MVGKKLAQLRKELGLTQRELANKLNVSDGAIAMYETDKRKLDLEKLITFCNFFSVSADYLLGLSDSRSSINSILSSKESNLLRLYKALNDEHQLKLEERAETLLEIQEDNTMQQNDAINPKKGA